MVDVHVLCTNIKIELSCCSGCSPQINIVPIYGNATNTSREVRQGNSFLLERRRGRKAAQGKDDGWEREGGGRGEGGESKEMDVGVERTKETRRGG